MNQKVINNLFELWRFIGMNAEVFYNGEGYNYVMPNNSSWPNTIFEIDQELVDFKGLHQRIRDGELPPSIAFGGNDSLEKRLVLHHFALKSMVKGMSLNLRGISKPVDYFPSIEKVDSEEKAIEFANIASASFGYRVAASIIIPLINKEPKIKLFIAKQGSTFSGCGLLYLDSNGISGLHMIGTLPGYRGQGLGKIMTNKLLLEAIENSSQQVVLVASEAGERIYSGMGFVIQGALKIYTPKSFLKTT